MAYAQEITPGDGSTLIYSIPFPFIKKEHVKVYVNGEPRTYTWLSSSQIKLDGDAPAVGVPVTRQRITPIDKRAVDFRDGSSITEASLDAQGDQFLYVSQESVDTATSALRLDTTGTYAAGGKRISGLADAVSPTDATTKRYVDLIPDAVAADRVATQAARDQAAISASNAAISETATAIDAENVAIARTEVQTLINSIGREEVVRVSEDHSIQFNENRYLLAVDATGGPIALTLPVISSVGEPFSVYIKKVDGSSNAVSVLLSGSDTLDGATIGYTLTVEGAGVKITADLEPDPDDWTSLSFGATSKVSQRDFLFVVNDEDAPQTIFSGTDWTGSAFGYTVGAVKVYVDGLRATLGEDFSAADGSSIVFTTGLPAGSEVIVEASASFALSDTKTSAEIDELLARVPNGEIGSVIAFAGSVPPLGYLPCGGAEFSRTEHPELFTVIGETFGPGDGSATANLPDLRGEFLRGWDDGRGVDAERVFGSSQSDAFQDHDHATQTGTIYANGKEAIGGAATSQQDEGNISKYSLLASAAGGYSTSTETRPRNVAILYCIKAFHPVRILTSGAEGVSKAGDKMEGELRGPDAVSDDGYVTKRQLSVPLFSKMYESPEGYYTYGALYSLSHGLGVVPPLMRVTYVCKTAEHGFEVGEEYDPASVQVWSDGSQYWSGVAASATSTSIKLQVGGNAPWILNASGRMQLLTPENWNIKVRAWA